MAGLRESWLADNHPPLFDILAWAGRRAAQSIEQLRPLNLLALLSALTGGWIVLRRLPQYWAPGTLFVLILAANETALRSGAELRSYFLSLCAASVAVIAVTVGWLEGSLSARGQRAVLSTALLIGLHLLRPVVTERYLTALIPAVAMGIAVGTCAAMRALPARLGNALMLGASA